MRSPHAPSFQAVSWRAHTLGLLLVVATLVVTSCYNPTLKGNFKCNTNYTAGAGDCPDGTHCVSGFCVSGNKVVDAGMDRASETRTEVHADVPAEAPAADVPAEVAPADAPVEMTCNMPVASCTADTSKKCDPVCQAGCTGCHEKCSANAQGTLTCNVPLNSRPRALGESCDIASLNAAAQTDNCAPGLVCLNDFCGSRCYHFCKTDADCPTSTCTHDAGGHVGVKVCEVPSVTCNPIKNLQPTGCIGGVQSCYLTGTMPDQTFCDCPSGDGPPNSACTIPNDCFYGLTCVDVTGTGSSVCRPVCSLAAGASDCSTGVCTAIKASKKFGFCN